MLQIIPDSTDNHSQSSKSRYSDTTDSLHAIPSISVPPLQHIAQIANLLNNDKIVALPTETVFGLAIALDSESALARLIKLKNRDIDSGKVFTLVPESPAAISNYAQIPPLAQRLIDEHFPGPLTLILPKSPAFHHPYFYHFQEIGLRIPDYPLYQQLLPISGPLLLTSANPRGEPPCTEPSAVIKRLPAVDAVLCQQSANTLPSTIIRITSNDAQIIRQGKLKPTIDQSL